MRYRSFATLVIATHASITLFIAGTIWTATGSPWWGITTAVLYAGLMTAYIARILTRLRDDVRGSRESQIIYQNWPLLIEIDDDQSPPPRAPSRAAIGGPTACEWCGFTPLEPRDDFCPKCGGRIPIAGAP